MSEKQLQKVPPGAIRPGNEVDKAVADGYAKLKAELDNMFGKKWKVTEWFDTKKKELFK